MISKNLEASLNRVLLIASNFNLKYAKVEHLLLALTKDVDVNYVLSRCNIRADKIINIDSILYGYSSDIKVFLQDNSELTINGVEHNSLFLCLIHRAIIRAHSLGKKKISGVNILVEILSEQNFYIEDYCRGKTRMIPI